MKAKPSISDLLELLNKPALLYWANKIGLEGVSLADYKRKSTAGGISLHEQVRGLFMNGIPIEDDELNKKAVQFLNEYEVLDMEQDIEFHFTGRYDIRAKKDGIQYVFDMKSSSTIYSEHVLQLCAYQLALPDVGGIGVISLKNFEPRIIQLTEDQHNAAIGMIRGLYMVWQNKSVIDQIRFQ